MTSSTVLSCSVWSQNAYSLQNHFISMILPSTNSATCLSVSIWLAMHLLHLQRLLEPCR